MINKQIIFTKKDTAELLDVEYRLPKGGEILVKTAFSTVSCGTEKANLTGFANRFSQNPFPVKNMGYSSAGTVIAKGDGVCNVEVGDRVVVYWGTHAKYNTVEQYKVVKIAEDAVTFPQAALSFIATFPLAAIRKTRLEIGESAIVMGLGLLGQIAVKLLRASGATPIIAADPIRERREEALLNGADFALDPLEEGFAKKVKELTSGGANVGIEVTGVGAGLDGILDCMARFGRVALLGCTRDKEFTIDYYSKVHFPGITLIGAHTQARPFYESHSGNFTHEDDLRAIFKLCATNRLNIDNLIKETLDPHECGEVYTRLANDENFPITVQFDWGLIE